MEYERVKWACRRGMLELDLVFEAYVLHRYPKADAAEQALFIAFLQSSDQDLFDWLLNKKTPAQTEFIPMIQILLHHAAH